MIRPDWKKFASKFSENPQFNFEWLCYLLFCKRFNKPYGIFRYKNQSALETSTIEVEGKVIGFQAKFYDVLLSKRQDEIIECLEKAKRDYPKLNTVYFYSNSDWTQAFPGEKGEVKAAPTAAEVAVKAKAKDLGIDIEWCLPSYFDSPYVIEKCQNICRMFFSENNSIFDFVDQQKAHTQTILDQINSELIFKDKTIIVERDDVLDQLKNGCLKLSIISGAGGVGKTLEIKKLYDVIHNEIPIFVFKATEFELRALSDFSKITDINDFAEAYHDSERKIIVIDSAEKLLELSNADPANEFITIMIRNNWQIIFTTRDHYFNDLNHLCIDIYRIDPKRIHINLLEIKYLKDLSEKNGFMLPADNKLLELLRVPLYLREYLQSIDENSVLDYVAFKNKLWDKKVKSRNVNRERIFISLALKRANNGSFFLEPDPNDLEIAEDLAKDGLLSSESTLYFIAHDIYEEWALERFINSAFIKKTTRQSFFSEIGQSLSVRRSFRNWISEKLLLNDSNTKTFLNEILEDTDLALFWKDEILVSILLSDYSSTFFNLYRDALFENNMEMSKRICFLLRVACKEVDGTILSQSGVDSELSLNHLFTKPKGFGWEGMIRFFYENINSIDSKNLQFILPLISEWTVSVKTGQTTHLSGLIALHIYKAKESFYSYGKNRGDKLLATISNSAQEIKDELHEILIEIIDNKYSDHQSTYYDLSSYILTSLESIPISKALPDDVLKIASLFWLKNTVDLDDYHLDQREINYGITSEHDFKYFPASAYQTPIFFLLKFDFIATLNFIINFVNQVAHNRSLKDGGQVSTKFKIDFKGLEIELFDDFDMWSSYRGDNNYPDLFSSVLMALEKYLLDISSNVSSEDLESILGYIIKKSKSCAMLGLVASLVLAHPEKLYRIAKFLFKVRDAFFADKQRWINDQQYGFNHNFVKQFTGGIVIDKILEDERLGSSNLKHRSYSLEDLFLRYQVIKYNGLSDDDILVHRNELWKILDDYYSLIDDNKFAEEKTWRLSLARMDIRKTEIKSENVDDKVEVTFIPHLDEDLKQFTEKSKENFEEKFKYIGLLNWANSKLNMNGNGKINDVYENNPSLALKMVNEIFSEASRLVKSGGDIESFLVTNKNIPVHVCASLIKFYKKQLSKTEFDVCVNTVLEFAERIFSDDYRYQSSDGMDACFFVINELLSCENKTRNRAKKIILAGLFRDDPINGMSGLRFSSLSIECIKRAWNEYKNDVESILFGYINLTERYLALLAKHFSRMNRGLSRRKDSLVGSLLNENKSIVNNVCNNKFSTSIASDLISLRLSEKVIVLDILSKKQVSAFDSLFFDLAKSIVFQIAGDNKRDGRDYVSKDRFFKIYARHVLLAEESDVQRLMSPFIENFNCYDLITDLIKEFLIAQDQLNAYDNFWKVWYIFKPNIKDLGTNGWYSHDQSKLIKAYLFVANWMDSAEEWNAFKLRDKKFFLEISRELALCSSTLFSIARLLNKIGYCYRNDGVVWLSIILSENLKLFTCDLEDDAVYYVEMYIKRYLHENRQFVKKNIETKNHVLTILNFLVERGQVSGYLLRESII